MKAYTKHKIVAGLLLILIIITGTNTVFATSSQLGSITVNFELKNTKFDVFKIGTVNENGIELSDDFKKYSIDIFSENAADTLDAYIKKDKLSPYASIVTDENATAKFKNLAKGVYLVTGDNFISKDFTYKIRPSMVSVPFFDKNSEYWNVNLEPKFEKITDNDDKTDIKVLKVWENYSENRTYPEVKVQLLKDWKVFDTVVLNEENDWKYVWKDLDKNCNWAVVEQDIAEGYVVQIENNNYVYTITNSESSTKPTPPTDPQSTPPVATEPPKLTQTGQLNWPIPVLVIMGAVLIIIGIAFMGKKNEE